MQKNKEKTTYKLNRYGQGYQDGQAQIFNAKPTVGFFQRLWLQISSRKYRHGFLTGNRDASIKAIQYPHEHQQPNRAYTDAEMQTSYELRKSAEKYNQH